MLTHRMDVPVRRAPLHAPLLSDVRHGCETSSQCLRIQAVKNHGVECTYVEEGEP